MKRFAFSMALLICCMAVSGQTVEQIFKDFKGKNNVETVHIGKFAMSLLKLMGGTMSFDKGSVSVGKGLHISSLNVLSLEGCSDSVMSDFTDKVSSLNLVRQGYELFLNACDNGEKVNIYVRSKNGSFREIVIISEEKGEAAIVQLFGKINPETLMNNFQ